MPLDKSSMAIGGLQADMKTLINVHSIIDNKLDKVIDSVAVINEKANKAHARIDDLLDPQTGLLTQAAANAAEAQETLRKGKWILLGFGAACTAGGTVFGSWMGKLGSLFAAGAGP